MAAKLGEPRLTNAERQRRFRARRGVAWASVTKDKLHELSELCSEVAELGSDLRMWGGEVPEDPPADILLEVLRRYRDVLARDYRAVIHEAEESGLLDR